VLTYLESDAAGDAAMTLKVMRARKRQRFDSSLSPPILCYEVLMATPRIKPYEEVPFTNSYGMTLHPGDPAVAVTKCAGSANLHFGRYLGRRGNRVVMQIKKFRRVFEHRETKIPYDYEAASRANPYPPYPVGGSRNPEYANYRQKVEEYGRIDKEMRKDYHYVSYPYIGYTELRSNKIFPGDLALRDL